MSENAKNEKTIETGETMKTTLKVLENIPFPGDMKTDICTSVQMAETISGLFADSMPDYYGCKVCIHDGHVPLFNNLGMRPGTLYVDLYFKDLSDDKEKKNIVLRGTNVDHRFDSNSLMAKFARINGAMSSANAYEVTKRTFDMLEEFMPRESRTRWADHVQEIVSPMGVFGKEEIVVCISGLDLNKIIAKIYGTNTKEGRFEYRATPVKNIPGKREFIMQVLQLDTKAVRDLQAELGVFDASTPQFYIYR